MEMENTVSSIFDNGSYNTDKGNLGYLENFYDNLLPKFKNTPINFLEIGVYHGGSIKLWKDYFHKKSNIYAADINYFDPIPGTFSVIGDMYSYEKINTFQDEYFDLIIDDGPHTFESFVLLIQRYFSKIKKSGTLVVEDVIDSNWVEPLVKLSNSIGYTNCEVNNMSGKQRTEVLLNSWMGGLYILNITK